MTSGVYTITNTITGEAYVGSAVDCGHRRQVHLSRLRNGSHPTKKLAASAAIHGADAFRFDVVEECPESQLGERESHWIRLLSPAFNSRRVTSNRPASGPRLAGVTRQVVNVSPAMDAALRRYAETLGPVPISGVLTHLVASQLKAEGLL